MKIRVHRAVWETSEFEVIPSSEMTIPAHDDSLESVRSLWEVLHSYAASEGMDDVSSGDSVGIAGEVEIVDDKGKTLATFDAETGADIVGQPGPLIRLDLDIAQHVIGSYVTPMAELSATVNRILRDRFGLNA